MDRFIFAALAALGALCFAVPVKADSNDTANMIAQCRVNLINCRNSIGLAVLTGGDWCAPKDMVMPTDAEVEGVLSWLEANPQVHPDDWEAASDAALEALYPCSK
ncbi:MAG: hypothetical protein KGJ49_08650 [Alphaproteobacteria bacterium]|nr:hypothetical protein [Alphaproteobacteria bacterium]